MSDFIIVGGGLIGMLVARELAVAGADVEVVERKSTGQESSWAGGGILSPLYPWRYPAAVSRLAKWSQQVYPEFSDALKEQTGVDPEWTASGLLIADVGAEREAVTGWAGEFGVQLDWIDASRALELQPGLGARESPLLWMPDIAQIRNPRLVRALRNSIQGLSVRIREPAEVRHIIVSAGAIAGVEVGSERLLSKNVIVCGGAWSADILASAGVQLPVEPVRGQMILLKTIPGSVQRIILSQDRYVIPRRDGHVLVGSTLEHVGFDKSTTHAAREALLAEAVRILPSLADASLEKHWAGLRPGTPDGVPRIGACPGVSGLYVAAGHFRNGVVLGPASARLLADEILARQPIVDPAPYRLAN